MVGGGVRSPTKRLVNGPGKDHSEQEPRDPAGLSSQPDTGSKAHAEPAPGVWRPSKATRPGVGPGRVEASISFDVPYREDGFSSPPHTPMREIFRAPSRFGVFGAPQAPRGTRESS